MLMTGSQIGPVYHQHSLMAKGITAMFKLQIYTLLLNYNLYSCNACQVRYPGPYVSGTDAQTGLWCKHTTKLIQLHILAA